MDPVDVSGMPGLLADPQTPTNHATSHSNGQADELDVDGLHGELADDQPALAHDIAGARHTSGATPGQILQADANGLPVDATNTDAEVDAAVGASHARQHAITDTVDHTSGATPGQILQADANGLPVDATNTDADVAATVLESKPQTLADQANIDWDLTLGGAAQVTLGGDRTLNAPTNMVNGARYRLKVIQDGTGTRLLTWNAIYRFPGGVDPCLTAAINCIDILIFDCDGTHMDCVSMVNALA
jgi:FlaG/FlaF family flagellin (archaellin)